MPTLAAAAAVALLLVGGGTWAVTNLVGGGGTKPNAGTTNGSGDTQPNAGTGTTNTPVTNPNAGTASINPAGRTSPNAGTGTATTAGDTNPSAGTGTTSAGNANPNAGTATANTAGGTNPNTRTSITNSAGGANPNAGTATANSAGGTNPDTRTGSANSTGGANPSAGTGTSNTSAGTSPDIGTGAANTAGGIKPNAGTGAANTAGGTAVAMVPGQLRSAIAAAIAPVACSLVSGDIRGDDVSLIGVAGAGAATADLHRAVTDAAPTAAVDWRVASFDGPYCRALDVIRPLAAGFGSAGSGLSMGLRSGSKPLTDGQLMTIDFTMPNYPAWLIVDYLQHDGTVWHMHPNAKAPARQYAPGTHISLGDPAAGGERWEVGAPYGTDMIIAVASSEPLFTQKRKELEPAETYLAVLRGSIETAQRRNQRLAADALVLTTEPKH